MDAYQREVASKKLPGEFSNDVKHTFGTLSMGRYDDPNSATSSFSILLGDAPHLDGQYAIFGRITRGEAALQAASLASTAEERAARVAQAVGLIQGHDGYIPLGAPIRWSLVSKRLSGFLPSPRGRHPLNHLFRSTN